MCRSGRSAAEHALPQRTRSAAEHALPQRTRSAAEHSRSAAEHSRSPAKKKASLSLPLCEALSLSLLQAFREIELAESAIHFGESAAEFRSSYEALLKTLPGELALHYQVWGIAPLTYHLSHTNLFHTNLFQPTSFHTKLSHTKLSHTMCLCTRNSSGNHPAGFSRDSAEPR